MNQMTKIPFTEMLKSIPGFFGIRLEEQPEHTVLETVGEVEIRRYAPSLLAQITLPGSHDEAVDEAFDRLARYIFGGNTDGEKLAMTSPVYQRPATKAMREGQVPDRWTIAFFLANNMQPHEAPQPNDAAIKLVTVSEHVVGALRYTGNNSDENRAEHRLQLLTDLQRTARWSVDEDVYWAQYDAPFTVPFLKRNEAMVALTAR